MNASENLVKKAPEEKEEKKAPDFRFPSLLSFGSMRAELFAAGDFSAVVRVPCALHPDTLRYAACRLFAKATELQKECVALSYALRFPRKGSPRRRLRCAQVPAAWFELAEGDAYVDFAVSAAGVRVERVWLLPAGARAPHRAWIRLCLKSNAPAEMPAEPAVPAAEPRPRSRRAGQAGNSLAFALRQWQGMAG